MRASSRTSSPSRPPAGNAWKGRISLARALSKFGVSSRKEAARLIEAGRVEVDGKVVLWPLRRIDPRGSVVAVDGRRVGEGAARLVLALNKPAGYITSRVDPAGRRTIYDLLSDVGRWVFPVGRLDRDTSGLLILTNDWHLGHHLTDPDHHVPKTYHAHVRGLPSEATLRILREGVPLDGGTTRPARVRSLGAAQGGGTWLELVLREGKNRQVRRMCAAVGHEVKALARVSIGGLTLAELASGEWRRLPPEDVARLKASN